MKFFKDDQNKVYAFQSIDEKNKFNQDLIEISEQEKNQLISKTKEHINSARKAEISARFSQIDLESVRPLRAIAAGTASQFDHDKITALETERSSLIDELKGL